MHHHERLRREGSMILAVLLALIVSSTIVGSIAVIGAVFCVIASIHTS